MAKPITNEHRVNARAWRGWSPNARRTFNGLYGVMTRNAWVFQPNSKTYVAPTKRQWAATAWNAAWVAADIVDEEPPTHVKTGSNTRKLK